MALFRPDRSVGVELAPRKPERLVRRQFIARFLEGTQTTAIEPKLRPGYAPLPDPALRFSETSLEWVHHRRSERLPSNLEDVYLWLLAVRLGEVEAAGRRVVGCTDRSSGAVINDSLQLPDGVWAGFPRFDVAVDHRQ